MFKLYLWIVQFEVGRKTNKDIVLGPGTMKFQNDTPQVYLVNFQGKVDNCKRSIIKQQIQWNQFKGSGEANYDHFFDKSAFGYFFFK